MARRPSARPARGPRGTGTSGLPGISVPEARRLLIELPVYPPIHFQWRMRALGPAAAETAAVAENAEVPHAIAAAE